MLVTKAWKGGQTDYTYDTRHNIATCMSQCRKQYINSFINLLYYYWFCSRRALSARPHPKEFLHYETKGWPLRDCVYEFTCRLVNVLDD